MRNGHFIQIPLRSWACAFAHPNQRTAGALAGCQSDSMAKRLLMAGSAGAATDTEDAHGCSRSRCAPEWRRTTGTCSAPAGAATIPGDPRCRRRFLVEHGRYPGPAPDGVDPSPEEATRRYAAGRRLASRDRVRPHPGDSQARLTRRSAHTWTAVAKTVADCFKFPNARRESPLAFEHLRPRYWTRVGAWVTFAAHGVAATLSQT